MPLTERQLNRATLARQLLLRREPIPAVEAVRRVVALQAQEPASPYVALWTRVAAFDPSALEAAFAARAVVKASLWRLTLHAVHADDYGPFHDALSPSLRASRLFDRRFGPSGLTIPEVDALLPGLAAYAGEPRTVPELRAHLEARLGEGHEAVWWAFRTFAPLHHVPTGGPWSFGPKAAFVAAPARRAGAHVEAVGHVVRRYLEGFGPATIQDVGTATILRMPVLREAIDRLGDEAVVRLEGPDGMALLDVPGGVVPDEDAAAPPRFLPMWDSTLLAYADRSRIIPPEYRKSVIRTNGDTLSTILVGGRVAGVWRPVDGGIEVAAFRALDDDAWAGLADEARSLLAVIVTRDPRLYRRYDRWWADLPAAEVRVLPG